MVFREIDGARIVAIYEAGKFRSVALAIEPEPVPAAWLERCGTWSVREPESQTFFRGMELAFDETQGFMTPQMHIASIPEPLVLPALPAGEDALVIAGLGRHMGETLRV